mgnify:CR=1 FL=1
MEPLPLALVGWLFTGLSLLALAIGALTVIAMHRAGETARQLLARTALNDALLFGIWFLGLAGGIGVLRLEEWGRHVLEFFCWVLIPLAAVSAATRLLEAKRQAGAEGAPFNWLLRAASSSTLPLLPRVGKLTLSSLSRKSRP